MYRLIFVFPGVDNDGVLLFARFQIRWVRGCWWIGGVELKITTFCELFEICMYFHLVSLKLDPLLPFFAILAN